MNSEDTPNNANEFDPRDPLSEILQPWCSHEITTKPIRAHQIISEYRRQRYRQRVWVCTSTILAVVAFLPFALKKLDWKQNVSSSDLATQSPNEPLPPQKEIANETPRRGPSQLHDGSLEFIHQPLSIRHSLARNASPAITSPTRTEDRLEDLQNQLQQVKLQAVRNNVIANMPFPTSL